MTQLTESEFLDFYSKAYDETTDKLGQIVYHKFSGEELFEFVNDAIEYKSKLKHGKSLLDYPIAYPKECMEDIIPPISLRQKVLNWLENEK